VGVGVKLLHRVLYCRSGLRGRRTWQGAIGAPARAWCGRKGRWQLGRDRYTDNVKQVFEWVNKRRNNRMMSYNTDSKVAISWKMNPITRLSVQLFSR